MNSYEDALQFINSYTKSGSPIKDLSRFSALMERLGNPQDSLKFIHIAGTNGKGSTLTYCASVLKNSGYKVGEYTSPYITDYTDRIKVCHENIDKDSVLRLSREIKSVCMEENYSQFEITTAIAFLYFHEQKCDVVCLETGIGGLLDATNIIKNPLISVVTSLGLDHTAILGNSSRKSPCKKQG